MISSDSACTRLLAAGKQPHNLIWLESQTRFFFNAACTRVVGVAAARRASVAVRAFL